MNHAASLLQELNARGLRVRAEAGQVRVAPAGALTPELRDRILSVKPELLRLLSPRPRLKRGLAVQEVLSLPADLLPQLPIPTTLVLDVPDVASPVLIATHVGCPRRAFTVDEWLAMASLAAGGDASSAAIKHWYFGGNRAQLAVSRGHACSAVRVADVLAAYGCMLRAVALEGELGNA